MSRTRRRVVLGTACLIAFLAIPTVARADANRPACSTILGHQTVNAPSDRVAWRAGVEGRTAVYDGLPGAKLHRSRWVGPTDAPWLLVVGPARAADRRCWLRVRLPSRPNNAAGWVNANNVLLRSTQWRIDISTAHHTLTLLQAGAPVRTVRVVVGKPTTPTPVGLFSVLWVVPWHPSDFLGSWVLMLTAHSNVLQEFDGGDGTVAIHGRGGASLEDPLGSARSHGCIRLSNDAIDWLVNKIGRDQLPGTPVQIS